MVRAGIVGGTGYTGVELLRILVLHPQIEVSVVPPAPTPDPESTSYIQACAAIAICNSVRRS